MARTAEQPATYEDLLRVPEQLVAEIIGGELHTHPRPAPRHARTTSAIGGKLFNPYDSGDGGPGGWWIMDEPELHLGSHVLVPDLAGWRRERMPELPETAWFELAPDWLCEVLSPHTARIDRVRKMPIYAESGGQYLWLVDPALRTLEAYLLTEEQWTLVHTFEEDEVVSIAPFDATEFRLGVLWG